VDAAQGYLFLVTERGIVKRVTVSDFLSAAPLDPVVINVDGKDRLLYVFHTPGDANVILVSSSGKAIRFEEGDVRSMGLAAAGVGGMKLKQGERVVYAGLVEPDGDLLTATEKGYAKRTSLSEYPTQGRNGGGVVTHKPNARTGDVSAALVLPPGDDLWVAAISAKNQVQPLSAGDVPRMGRGVQGKQIFAIGLGDALAAVQMLTLPDPAAGPDRKPPSADEDKAAKSTSSKKASATQTKRAGMRKQPATTKASADAKTRVKVSAKAAPKAVARSRKSTSSQSPPPKTSATKTAPAKSKTSASRRGKDASPKSKTRAKSKPKTSTKTTAKNAQLPPPLQQVH